MGMGAHHQVQKAESRIEQDILDVRTKRCKKLEKVEILPRGYDDLCAKIALLDFLNCSALYRHLNSLDWHQKRRAFSTWMQKVDYPWRIQTHCHSTRLFLMVHYSVARVHQHRLHLVAR